MLEIVNKTDFSVNEARLELIAGSLGENLIECIFVNSDEMRELNLNSRGQDKTTDVLSFPLEPLPYAPLGSIVINIELADQSARQFGHSLDDECTLLFIHGILHLLGFDHESDNGQMREKERELIERFKLPKSLILRNC